MVKARAWLALVVISFGTVAATVSCGSDEVTGGGGGIGGGFLTGGSGGAAGKGGAVGRGGSGGGTTTTSALGTTCTADLGCGEGLTCVLPNDPTLPSGGPAKGLCTLPCTANSDCSAVSAGAGCVIFEVDATQNPTAAYCLESCAQGDPGTDQSSKCHGRLDEACTAYSSGATLCSPLCVSDAQCGTGLFCDRNTGLCSATKTTGDPAGTSCDPMAATNNCLGICLITSAMGVTPQTGVCSQLCPLGTPCMFTGAKPGGTCLGALTATPGIGDLGFCEPACACSSDCKITGDLCRAWTAAEAASKSAIGSDGFCFPTASGSTELTCGASEGGAGGASNTGGNMAGAAGN